MGPRLREREWIIEAAKEAGNEPPEFDEPPMPRVLPHVELYHRCYMDTSTHRGIGMAVGPIPYREVMDWGGDRGMRFDECEAMWRVITTADNEYLERQNKKAEADAKRNDPRPERKGQKTRRGR